MPRVVDDLIARPLFHDLPLEHHRDAVADMVDNRDVVADEQVGEAQLLLEVLEQVQDLRLHRYVESARGLVTDNEPRFARQGARDPDALALTARELVRVAVDGIGGEPDAVEHLLHPRAQRPSAAQAVHQQRLAHGPLTEYPQYPHGTFGEATPRSGNASGGGQPGWIVKCKGWETDPNAYIYVVTQAAAWPKLCRVIGKEEWIDDPAYAKPDARLDKLAHIFATIEEWTKTKTKFEVMDILNPLDVPCGPILSMKEIAEEPSLRATGTVVEVDHPTRGRYLTVGNPIKLSDSPADVRRSPLLGEHNDEILRDVLGLSDEEAEVYKSAGALGAPTAAAAE